MLRSGGGTYSPVDAAPQILSISLSEQNPAQEKLTPQRRSLPYLYKEAVKLCVLTEAGRQRVGRDSLRFDSMSENLLLKSL